MGDRENLLMKAKALAALASGYEDNAVEAWKRIAEQAESLRQRLVGE